MNPTVLERILSSPSGLGTSGLRLGRPDAPEEEEPVDAPGAGTPIPGLYYHPVPEPDAERSA